MIYLYVHFTITLVAVMVLPQSASAQEDRDPEIWIPASTLLDRLGPETEFQSYSVRPPKGYTVALRQQKEGFHMIAWKGEPREDQTVPSFMVTLTTIPPRDKMTTPDNYVISDLLNVRKRRLNMKQTPVEIGKIDGMVAARSYWEADNHNNRGMSGFTYVCIDERNVITIIAQAYSPDIDKTQLLLETAALTIRKP